MSKTVWVKRITSGLILLVLLVVYFSYIKEGKTQAGLVSLKGWAWIGADCTDPTENSCGTQTSPIGWISLSSNNPEITCKNITYGVNINPSTGEISGSAWIGVGEDAITTDCNKSENTVGWLYFDSNQTPTCGQNGYPSDYCFPAKLVGNEIQGWVPIISKDYLGNTTIVTWVRFKGSNYVVTFDSTNQSLLGYAWSGWGKDGGLGWIKFNASSSLTVSCYASPNPADVNETVTFTANATGGTGSYIYSWSGACTGSSQTCQKSFSSAGTYTATVNVTSGSQTKSASCSVTVQSSSSNTPGGTANGICQPYVNNRVKFPDGSWSQEAQYLVVNNPGSNKISKDDLVQLDVKLSNKGQDVTAQCKYKTCTSESSASCCVYGHTEYYSCCTGYEYNTTTQTWECVSWGTCERFVCDQWGKYNYCTGWSEEKTETISNPSDCTLKGGSVNISVFINQLFKFLDIALTNTFSVDSKSTITGNPAILNQLDKWASQLGYNINIKPQRHGYFLFDSKQIGGAVYNNPNVISRSDDSFSSACAVSPASVIGVRDYTNCQECRWTGSGWNCPWSNVNKGFYTIFNESAASDPKVNGSQPISAEPGTIKFYTRPTNVESYLNVEKSQAPTPPSDQVKTPLRDWIAGFPFKINYGVDIGPGKFAKDLGDFWFELTGESLPFTCTISPTQKTNVSDSSIRQTTTCTPQKAGDLTITSKHNADDEEVSRNITGEAYGDEESKSQTITIYRYLCYQGFCWECPKEPQLQGVVLNVKGAGCQPVEDAKCQTYINKSCKAGVRE
jgi:hypothetical protein